MGNNIKLVKFTSGEEVVSKIKVDGDRLTLFKPVRAVPTPEGLAIMPWLPLCKKGSNPTVKLEHVLTVVDVDTDLERTYNEKIHGGISLATPQETGLLGYYSNND